MTTSGPADPEQTTPQPAPPQPAPPGAPAPAEWAWAQRQAVQRTEETEPLAYHRLLRGVSGHRWWKPLLLLVLSGVYYGVFTVALTFSMLPIISAFDPEYLLRVSADANAALDTQHPVSVVFSMLSIIIMIPAVLLAMLSLGVRPTGRIWSVAGRLRWGLLGRLLIAAVIAVVAMNAVGIGIGFVLDPAGSSADVVEAPAGFDWTPAIVSMVLCLVLVPFQATAEEVVFRGLFMQVLGSWLKSPWFGILIPSIGFALAHIYDLWGLAAVGLMGGVAAWLAWRTGGLEAAIAIHTINNLVAFGLLATGITGETGQTSDSGGAASLVGEVVGLAVFVWLALRIFRAGGHGRTRIDLVVRTEYVDAPVAPAAGPVAPAPYPATRSTPDEGPSA